MAAKAKTPMVIRMAFICVSFFMTIILAKSICTQQVIEVELMKAAYLI